MREAVRERLEGLIEQLEEKEHERWAHWQRYMHEQCKQEANGDLTIPARLVSQWQRQIDTPYNELTEKEKDSDREQVMNYIPLISSELSEL